MRQLLKRIAIASLGLLGAYPTAMTHRSDLTRLIHKLHPTSPGTRLVRLGPTGDGGYLVPDDLVDIAACFSPGVGKISGFEKHCAELGMRVFLADKTVSGPAVPHDNFNFTKKHVGATSSEDFMTIDDWVDSSLPGSRSDLLLQMDIEGYEYETFLSMPNSLMRRLRIIVAEFHDLDKLWSRPFFQVASAVFDKILQTHTCVHIHPNNRNGLVRNHGLDIPRAMEFSFLRNDRIKNPSLAVMFPHPLDSDNSSKPPLRLPKCWYKEQ